MTRLGLIAGGGALPLALAAHCAEQGRPLFVIRLKGFADPGLMTFEGDDAGLGEVGRIVRLAREANCTTLCLAGRVPRPNLAALKLDLKGVAIVPGLVVAARQGDEGLLRYLTGVLEKEGFVLEGAHEVMGALTLPPGPLGRHTPSPDDEKDMAKAISAARTIGALDAGQGAVVCDGLVLALEAQEGTDAMLRRVADLPPQLRGSPERRRGVLAKVAKPIQDERVDLPTIGPDTIAEADRAGLAGVVGVAGKMIVLERSSLVAAADACGIFVVGAPDAAP